MHNYGFKYHDRVRVYVNKNSRTIIHDKTTFPRKRQVEKNLGNQPKNDRHMLRDSYRNVPRGQDNSMLSKLELENQVLKVKFVDLERTLARFANESKGLDMVL